MKLYFKRDENTEFHSSIRSLQKFFLLEDDKWEFTSTLSEAKLVLTSLLELVNKPNLSSKLHPDQIVLIWIAETCGDAAGPNHYRSLVFDSEFIKNHNKFLCVHSNMLDVDDPRFIPHQIMFNRHKLFCVDYDEAYDVPMHWIYNAPRSTYSISPINKVFSQDNKTFFCPIRIYYKDVVGQENYNLGNFNNIKIKLKKFLENINCNMYISDPQRGVFFKPNGWEENPETYNIDTKTGGSWYPAADKYYQTSYVSIAIESIVRESNIFYPCEKSFDPLIKGNFPLIFSSPYFIERMKKYYNFKFPDWIDYSYDSITNLNERLDAFCNSIKKISELPLEKLHELYIKDKHILEHNRSIFYNTPYDHLYPKVKKSIELLGW